MKKEEETKEELQEYIKKLEVGDKIIVAGGGEQIVLSANKNGIYTYYPKNGNSDLYNCYYFDREESNAYRCIKQIIPAQYGQERPFTNDHIEALEIIKEKGYPIKALPEVNYRLDQVIKKIKTYSYKNLPPKFSDEEIKREQDTIEEHEELRKTFSDVDIIKKISERIAIHKSTLIKMKHHREG